MSTLENGDEQVGSKPKTPWHLWVVGILAVIWNSGGAIDYTMTQTQNEAYLSQFTPEQLDYFSSFPAWADAFWASGVWGALIGSLLILLRSRYALIAFVISLLGLAGSTAHQFIADMPPSLNTPGIWVFTAVIALSIILLIIYVRKMTANGVLR